jgi:hypothetical protein
LGYEENGRYLDAPRGEPVEFIRWRLTRARWEEVRAADDGLPVAVTGIDECLEMFGRPSAREVASGDIDQKRRALRAAVRHDHPAGDIEDMLAEIARGRGDDAAEDEP